MESPKLSIIVPCYNVAPYVGACLDSLLSQTATGLEIIAVNDGSTDGTLAILEGYGERHPDTVTVVDQENAGAWYARLAGIETASGAYIGFVDGDDTVEPVFAERLIAISEGTDADIAVCGFSRIESETGKILSQEYCDKRPPFSLMSDPGRIVELNGALWNKIFRADLLKGSATIEHPPAVLEDLTLGLLAYARTGRDIVFLPEPLVNYQVRPGSAIASADAQKVDEAREALRQVREHYERNGFEPAVLEALDAAAFLHLGVSLPFRLLHLDKEDFNRELAETTDFLNRHFPTWRRSPYIRVSYAATHNVAFAKLLGAQQVYKAHLLGPALNVYCFLIDKLHIDIKW